MPSFARHTTTSTARIQRLKPFVPPPVPPIPIGLALLPQKADQSSQPPLQRHTSLPVKQLSGRISPLPVAATSKGADSKPPASPLPSMPHVLPGAVQEGREDATATESIHPDVNPAISRSVSVAATIQAERKSQVEASKTQCIGFIPSPDYIC